MEQQPELEGKLLESCFSLSQNGKLRSQVHYRHCNHKQIEVETKDWPFKQLPASRLCPTPRAVCIEPGNFSERATGQVGLGGSAPSTVSVGLVINSCNVKSGACVDMPRFSRQDSLFLRGALICGVFNTERKHRDYPQNQNFFSGFFF